MSNDELARRVFMARRGFDQAIIDLGSSLLEGRDSAEVTKLVRLQALSLAELTHEIDRSRMREESRCSKS